jgi:hypothetical protein
MKRRRRNWKKHLTRCFSTKTGYEELDKRTALTKQKKEELLLVLRFPKIPLHNNTAELALRELVVKRKISNGTRSEDGRTARETMMTLLDTCRNWAFLSLIIYERWERRVEEEAF